MFSYKPFYQFTKPFFRNGGRFFFDYFSAYILEVDDDGEFARKLGIKGISDEAEWKQIERDHSDWELHLFGEGEEKEKIFRIIKVQYKNDVQKDRGNDAQKADDNQLTP